MRKINNWEEVKEGGVSLSLPIGPQVCEIRSVVDDMSKEYLKIEFDICDGEFKNAFQAAYEQFGNWPAQGTTYRSYKPKAESFFKSFITAVEKSNGLYSWDWNEKSLVGKKVVVNFGEEEYEDNGQVKVSIKAREFRSIIALREGKVETLQLKKLKNAPKPVEVTPITEEDLPF
jgi:hypothetical protein